METISEKLDYINKEIKNTNVNLLGDFHIHLNKAKEIKYKFYYNSRNKLKNIDSKILLKHNFQAEILSLAELLEKKVVINKIINTKKIKIEKHKFAPELNKVIINKNTFDAPYVINIDKEITTYQKLENHKYINLKQFLNKLSISKLNNILVLN